MFSPIRKRLTYANVVATFALVFAMSGGALAASKFLITSSKQIKPSVLASLKGKAGANGAQGAAGAQGTQGPAGAAGAKGENGAAGANGTNGEPGKEGAPGTNGKNGKTVVVAKEEPGANCVEGGSSFEVEGSGAKHYACNGSPWTPNNTLPSGATETGSWAIGVEPPGVEFPEKQLIALSFPIQLKASLAAAHVHFIEEEGNEVGTGVPPTECGTPAGSAAEPKASPGDLCVYTTYDKHVEYVGISMSGEGLGRPGASTTGALLEIRPENEKGGALPEAIGTWALTEN